MDETQQHPPEEVPQLAEPVLLPPRGLWAVALALFVLTAIAGVLWAPPLHPRTLPNLALNTWHDVDLAAMRQPDDALLRLKATSHEQQELERTIQAQFKLYLKREAALSGQTADDAAARMALGAVEESVRTLVQRFGLDALRRLAVQFGRDVHAALATAISAAHAARQPFAVHLQTQPPPADVSALTDLSGALGATLERIGIDRQVHDGQLDPVAGQVIEAIAQARFLQLAARIPGDAPQVASAEWLLVQHFRVEAHAGLDLQRRLALLDELATSDPAYPGDYARGILLAREEQFTNAIPWFERASRHGPFARQARDNARWCRERVQQAATLPPPPAP